MRIKTLLLPTLMLGAGLALARRALRPTPADVPATRRNSNGCSTDAIDAYFQQQMRRLKIPGASLAVVEGDRIVHLRGFGRCGPRGKAPTPQTPFFLGSITKSFTALAVMQLIESGKVEPDAPIQLYLPWFHLSDPEAAAQISVRHLLNQTSSLPLLESWRLLADFDDSPDAGERQARSLSTLAISRPIGSEFEYSNINYNLLGLIIEAVSGGSYAEYIQKHIFDPLNMNHSHTSKAAAKKDGLAVGHRYWFGFPVPAPDLPVPGGSLPSGQLISSAEDMGRYLIAHLNAGRYGEAQILSPEGMRELHRPAVDASGWGVTEYYAMGWYVRDQEGSTAAWHSGMTPDFYAYMALLPEQNKGVVLLINANHFTGQLIFTEIGEGVTNLLAGRAPASIQFGAVPWVLRAFLLIPLFQIGGAISLLRMLARWRRDPAERPSSRRVWGRLILLPLLPDLAIGALSVFLRSSGLSGFMQLFLPDLSCLLGISAGLAGILGTLRTGLILRFLSTASLPPDLRSR